MHWPARFYFVLAAILLALSSSLALAQDKGVRVEDVGVVGFRQDFYATLTLTPFACDRTVPGGAGHSRVTYTGKEDVFDASWVKRGVEFVAYRIHKNGALITPEAYFPGVMGSRYARVVQVIDPRTLVVDFEYNGGSIDTPRISEKASGYFFIDCGPALRKMVQAPNRPERFIFESGRTYVCKGMPNILFRAAEQTRDMRWVASDPTRHAAVKISAEDAINVRERGVDSKLPGGAFFDLDTHNRSIYLDGINILGPTFTVPVVQESWGGVMFAYSRGECERTLEIRNCNTFAEKYAVAAAGAKLPEGANWLAPDITGIVAGGGRRGDRGDGVIDIVGYQRFNLIRSTWVSKCIHSIKNNDGAGNWITIDGEEVDANGRPVHLVYEAQYVKRGEFTDITLSFHDFQGDGARRGVRVESDDFAWPMLENQYWTGGLSTSSSDSTHLQVDGFSLYFGNNGDWRRELADSNAYHCVRNANEALLFDRIPKLGDTIPVEKTGDGTLRIWGWGVQEGDILAQDGKQFEIAGRKRRTSSGPILGITHPGSGSGYAHYWEIKFKDGAQPDGDRPSLKVVKSRTAYLLDGKPRKAVAFFRNDLYGHWQYNRGEVNYEYRNICFNGNLRQTVGPAHGGEEYQGLWELPVKHEWVNCWAMDSDGSERGVPAREIRSEGFNKSVLQLRNQHPDSKRHDHHILVDGGHLFAQRLSEKQSPLWLRNRPQLIYGSASFGEPRICNPVLMDTKGLDCSMSDISFSLVGGHTLDLSNSVFGSTEFGRPALMRLYGNGTVILDNVRFAEAAWRKGQASGGISTMAALGLQQDIFKLHMRGKGGVGGFHLLGKPEDGSLTLIDWTLRKMPYCDHGVEISTDNWQKLAEKIVVNGTPAKQVKN